MDIGGCKLTPTGIFNSNGYWYKGGGGCSSKINEKILPCLNKNVTYLNTWRAKNNRNMLNSL